MRDPTIHRIESVLRNPLVIVGGGAALGALTIVVLWLALPLYRWVLADPFWFRIVVLALIVNLLMGCAGLCIFFERKIAAYTQDRFGPNRVGWWGLLQTVADGVKLMFKENIIPHHVEKPLFLLAPSIAMGTSLLGLAIIPWAGEVRWPWMTAGTVSTQIADLNIGVLYLLAVGSIGVYATVLAGYASNNKYAFFGGIRATAQMISYELPLGLALLVVLLSTGTLKLDAIVQQQAAGGVWNVFLHPVAFFLVLVSAFAETNRAPFDLAEAEQELVAGFHTEYSGMKFGMFFLGEYIHMMTNSALMVALFFGGWAPLPFTSWYSTGPDGLVAPTWWNVGWVAMFLKFGVYFGKVAVFIAFYMMIRWTLPRLRFDQLMRVAWQALVPAGVALLALTAVLTHFGWQRNLPACLGANLLLLVAILGWAARARRPVTGRQADLPSPGWTPT